MALSNMQVFDEYIMPATMVTLDQEIEKFNAASGGAIVLSSEGMTGDFYHESFFNTLQAAGRRVDRYAANAAVAATPLQEADMVGVKVAGGFGPISYEPSQMTWLERPTQEGVQKAAEAFAQVLLRDQLNTAIGSAVAAISNNATTTNDVSGGATVTYAAMNNAHALFGDMSSNLVASVMSGVMAHKLVGQNLANTERLFQYGSVNVIDILGKTVVITDAPALTGTGPATDRVLSLAPNGAVISGASSVVTNTETSNGNARIETTFQADYDFVVSLKGYAWNIASGGKSPTDAALGTGANWTKVADFDKQTAGVITIGDA